MNATVTDALDARGARNCGSAHLRVMSHEVPDTRRAAAPTFRSSARSVSPSVFVNRSTRVTTTAV